MRTQLMAAAAVTALVLGAGAAWAQQTPGSQPGMPAEQDRPEESAPGSTTPGATTTPGGSMAPSEGQSYRDNEASFSGSIARGYNADELLGQDIVTREGEEVGEIKDLLIGPDGRVTHAIIGRGGFLGIGEKNVPVDLESLQQQDGAFVTEMTEQELDSMPRYEKSEGRWMQAASEAEGSPAGTTSPGQPPGGTYSPGQQ